MNTTPETKEGEIPPVMFDSLDTLVFALSKWHEKQVQLLAHTLTIPEGSGIELPGTNGPINVVLQGDTLEGFKAGVNYALILLGSLPIMTITEPAATDDADGSNPAS